MSDCKDDEVIENPDPHFEPIVNLPPVQTKTLEEDEEELVKLRAKLFRYDSESEPREWKERGTGEMKILKHKQHGTCRVLMRRDKTLKICANHYVLPHLELKTNCDSDRAWVWSTNDFADEEPKPELLAVRFANAENAQKFREVFEQAKKIMSQRLHTADDGEKVVSSTTKDDDEEADTTADTSVDEQEENQVTKELQKLKVADADDHEKKDDEKKECNNKLAEAQVPDTDTDAKTSK